MNILVLESDAREMAVIQQALAGHTATPVNSSAQAWSNLQQGGFQLLIVNLDTTDAGDLKLISRIHAAYPDAPIYILLLAMGDSDDEKYANDILYRPYTDADLKNRIAVAERFISLAEKFSALQRRLESQVAFDHLTGFMNRPAFLRQAAGELERSRRASLSMSVVILDIDNFTTINERFGAKIGNDVLEVVAESIREKSRPYDCIGRWAGDEFVIALPGVIGADAEKMAERIMSGIRSTRIEIPNEAPLNVSVSAGIASVLRITANTEVDSLILASHESALRAKEAGGNQVFLAFL